MPSMRKSPSKVSLGESSSTTGGGGTNVSSVMSKKPAPPALLTVDVDAERPRSGNVKLEVPESAVGGLTPMVQAVNARLMERTPFAIDDAGDEDDESDDEGEEGGDDDQVMDEVCARVFGLLCGLLMGFVVGSRWTLFLRLMIQV